MYVNTQSPFTSATRLPYMTQQTYPVRPFENIPINNVPTTTVYVDPKKITQPITYQRQQQLSPSTDYGYRDSQLQLQYQDLIKRYQDLQIELSHLQRQISDRNDRNVPNNSLDLLNQRLQYYVAENDKLKKQLGYTTELQEKLEIVTTQLEKVNDALQLSNQENEQLIQQINDYRTQSGFAFQLNQTIQVQEIQLSQKNELIKNLQSEIEIFQQVLQQKTIEFQQEHMKNNQLINQNQLLLQELELQKRNALKLKQDIVSLQIDQSQLGLLKRDNLQANEKYNELFRNYEQTKAINQDLLLERNKQQQIETYVDQLVEQLNDMRQRLEIATHNILILQNKLTDLDFVQNERGKLEVQYENLKQNYTILELDHNKLKDVLQQKQIELEVQKNSNMQYSQRLQQNTNNVLVQELKLEIESWKSKQTRMEQLYQEQSKQESIKLKCLQDQNAHQQQIINELQQQLQQNQVELIQLNTTLNETMKKLRDKDTQSQFFAIQPNQSQDEIQALKNRIKILEQYDEKTITLQKEISRLNALTSQLRSELSVYKNKQSDYQFLDDQYQKQNKQMQELKGHIAQLQK